MNQKLVYFMLILMLVLAFSVNAAESTQQIAEQAELIIIGKVVDLNAAWDAKKTSIQTRVTVDVYEYLKGESEAKTQSFVMMGGTVGDVAMNVEQAPPIQVGEMVVLFLGANQELINKEMTIVGFNQGKYTIKDNMIVETGKSLFAFKKEILEQLGKIPAKELQVPDKVQFLNPELLEARADKVIRIADQQVQTTNSNGHSDDWNYGYECVWGDDFEDGFPGTNWILGRNANPGVNNGYTWGRTQTNAYAGEHAVWCAQTNMISGNPDLQAGVDPYPNNTQAWMIAGPFDLSDVYSARLYFKIYQEINSYDWTGVGFSIDGVWFTLGPDFQFFYNSTGGWIDYVVNIEDVIGPLWDKTNVWICFIFWSDYKFNAPGTWIDNVKLHKYDPHGSNPFISEIIPPKRSAGTGGTIEIHGNHFTNYLNTPGHTFVEFFSGFHWWDDSLWVPAVNVAELTKTKIVCDVPTGASSGKVRIRREKSGECEADFGVSFGYLGCRWYAGVGNAKGDDYPIVPFHINPNCPDVPADLAHKDIFNSAYTWNGYGNAGVTLRYEGTSSVTSPQFDGENTVMFAPITHIPFGVPGLTYIWRSGDKILEADIVLNSLYPWARDKSASPDPIRVIIANIATNEFGNMLGLSDLYGAKDRSKSMYGYHDVNAEQFILDNHAISLHNEDIEGLQWIYGVGLDPNFTADATAGLSPMTVQFTDQTKSKYPIIRWKWDFGDGSPTSDNQNPVHTYETGGEEAKFNVTLTVVSQSASRKYWQKIIKKQFIKVGARVAADIDAETTVGYGPLSVQFINKTKGSANHFQWDFGDGTTSKERNPVHVYENPGVYNVIMTASGYGGTHTEMVASMVEVYDETQHIGLTNLELVEGSECWRGEGWDNAIDHDTYHASGTTNAGKKGDVQAIFQFDDGTVKKINRVRMMTDTGLPNKSGDWVQAFSLYVSTKDTKPESFKKVGTFEKTNEAWDNFTFDAVKAKYIKIVIEEPNSGWRQIGEFEVYEAVELADISGSSISVTSPHVANGLDAAQVTITLADKDGNPISGLRTSAFRIAAIPGIENTTEATTEAPIIEDNSIFIPVQETDTPGTYHGSVTSLVAGKKRIIARVYGMKLAEGNQAEFIAPELVKAKLTFVKGSETWRGEDWENAIDGDIEGSDGTVSAGPLWGDCYGIFEVADATKPLISYRIMTDTGMEKKRHLVTQYEMYVSTSGTKDEDFELVSYRERNNGEWETFIFSPVFAKYVKIVLLEPQHTWRQIGELEIYTTEPIGMSKGIAGRKAKAVAELPKTFGLEQNYPNPFNPETSISYQIPEAGNVVLKVYNMLGQEIRTLVNATQGAGRYQVIWDARDLNGKQVSSGVYFYSIKATCGEQKFEKKMKMTLLK